MDNLSIGVDIATSLAILGAFVSWTLDNHRQRRMAREVGINDQARAIAVTKVQETTIQLSKDFNSMITNAGKIERRLNRLWKQDGVDAVQRHIEQNDDYLEEVGEYLQAFKDEVSRYYESCHVHKYLLFPVLGSLPEGDGMVASIKSDFDDIARCHDEINSGYAHLLRELEGAVKIAGKLSKVDEQDPEHAALKKKLVNAVSSIAYDPDYKEFIHYFIPDGQEEAFYREYDNREIQDQELSGVVIGNLYGTLIKRPARAQAMCLLLARQSIQRTRTECKEVLCSLSAVASVLLSRNEESTLSAEIAKLKSDDFFALDREIR
ncbi:hypothetical protein [Halomonas sp. DN3]|uniref:hypothetical protein n=1 Tax=Halomonas sp. DN3 TaxID=2953657 RepID=UPI00209FF406|nr:hypothetical protein [Halomonas sp. DN3]USZ51294.1 hypothetical protein NKF27_07310 [Halomonas sp. DN3]